MYIYQDIGFRPIDHEDLEALRALYNDMTTFLQLGTPDMVTSEEQVDWWKHSSEDKRNRRYCIVGGEAHRAVIGILRIRNINHVNKNCEVGLDIVPAHRGQGYGRKSYEMILEYLFKHLNMHTVYLRVIDMNRRARALYERVGFELTGKFPEFIYRNGTYRDYLLMSITRQVYDARYGASRVEEG